MMIRLAAGLLQVVVVPHSRRGGRRGDGLLLPRLEGCLGDCAKRRRNEEECCCCCCWEDMLCCDHSMVEAASRI